VPRSLEFLFSRDRLYVAVSHAMCLTFVVASPRLLGSGARTIEQMRLINALCRFVEMRRSDGHVALSARSLIFDPSGLCDPAGGIENFERDKIACRVVVQDHAGLTFVTLRHGDALL
jgi:hypothetical protein